MYYTLQKKSNLPMKKAIGKLLNSIGILIYQQISVGKTLKSLNI